MFVYVDDLDATVERLRRDTMILGEPAEMPWGERIVYVSDPEGNPVALAAHPRYPALIIRNGLARPRKVTTAAGELEIQAPRVNDRRQGICFRSAILPPTHGARPR